MANNQRIRRLPLSQRLWKAAPANATDRYLIHARRAYPFRDLAVPVNDPALRASFAAYNAMPQDEHMIWYRQPVLIEPSYGFALTGPRTLLLQSMPYYERVGLPDFLKYAWRRYIRREPVRYERCVISLREFGDDNYYHLYSDVLGRLALLDRWPETRDMPIVISDLLARRPYFQQALARSTTLRHRRWIVHARGFIHADSILLPKVMPHQGSTFDFLLDQLQPPPADPHATRRIFLLRRSDRRRQLVNVDQLAQICAAFGFDTIDTDGLDLEAQMRIFASARYVVGTHGAGLVNLIFRQGHPLTLLELFPPDNIPPHYFWLCHHFGYSYDALVGEAAPGVQAFHIDPSTLQAALTRVFDDHLGSDSSIASLGRRA